ncbi:hypothetical protein ACFPN2_25160 [Steroidobacter flavus]|uniref:Uncharacterized protein n=1 Tax=Steroidobacter flavus TaxID=1842136 RepID=A0ABV8SY23_9GAMM
MKQAISSRQAAIDAQGDAHHEIDLRLVTRIGQALTPLIGPSEGKGAVWFQSMDWYGDGIRHLEFQPNRFPVHSIPKLQALLQDEYSPFGILCWTPFEPNVRAEQEQGLVIFSDTLVMTARVASQMTEHRKSRS